MINAFVPARCLQGHRHRHLWQQLEVRFESLFQPQEFYCCSSSRHLPLQTTSPPLTNLMSGVTCLNWFCSLFLGYFLGPVCVDLSYFQGSCLQTVTNKDKLDLDEKHVLLLDRQWDHLNINGLIGASLHVKPIHTNTCFWRCWYSSTGY